MSLLPYQWAAPPTPAGLETWDLQTPARASHGTPGELLPSSCKERLPYPSQVITHQHPHHAQQAPLPLQILSLCARGPRSPAPVQVHPCNPMGHTHFAAEQGRLGAVVVGDKGQAA